MPKRLSKEQLASRIWRSPIGDEVAAELAFHIEMVTRDLVAGGMDEKSARAEAVRRFGDLSAVSNTCATIGTHTEREMRRTEFLTELKQDITFALRQLVRTPSFTILATLTLALGIGATTAIFSAVQSIVIRSFPWEHPDRVMEVSELWRERRGNVSVGNYAVLRDRTASFDALAALQSSNLNLGDASGTERIIGGKVTHNFFSVFGARPLLGRVFRSEEDTPGTDAVVVLSHALWTRRFGADPAVVGTDIRLSGRPYRILAVMRPDFDPLLMQHELWMPIAFTPAQIAQMDEHYLRVVGLLKNGVRAERAEQEMRAIGKELEIVSIANHERSFTLQPLSQLLIGDYRQRMFVLLGAVSLVLLIACSNVANLLLARSAARRKEIAIRASLGASRGRIARQMLTESAALALLAAVVGVALAWAGIRLLIAIAPAGIPRIGETRIDLTVLLFALGTAIVSSVVFGIVPALRATRTDLQGVLREGGRGSGSARDRVRNVLIVAEVALALTLLVGAGLLIRSARALENQPLGFAPQGVLAARVTLPRDSYADPANVIRTFQQMADGLASTPGVRDAALSSQAPLGGGGGSNGLIPEGKALVPENAVDALLRIVTDGFFTTLQIPITRGRGFTREDVTGGTRVMVVSEELARRMWPDEDPIGKRVACCEGEPGDPRWKTVIGVAGDVRTRGPAIAPLPEFYLPTAQAPPEAWDWIQRQMTLVARGTGTDASVLAAPMRNAVRAVDPALPLYQIRPMTEALRVALSEARFNTILLTTLGALGLILAAIGIYSVVAYFVSLRTHEIGLRMALGAAPLDVVRMMAWQGARPILLGVLVGAIGAFALTRLLRNALFGVSASDPLTFASVATLLIAVGLVATLVPARRATNVDRTRALMKR